ncbi:ABC transporter ATP-binding protein [Bacillus carboniphilus]|uniref:ABC transporter ATP-binding protein n=1 Tax=Bacillus carboniphilus TaxID=86663 RepID=A0ABY9JPP5_9BACI|nr:ABC transporter ATP-binding protein [Bacillus carboniphilus]WLR41380.1 ABC transporter ATP-binding protein [Bacillus carboniphilus]
MNVVEVNQLTKMYGKSRGILNVSLQVKQGEIFGFIGPNGAGKSTFIRTILSLIYPTSGGAKIFGKDCKKFAPEIAKDIGYLPSEVFYYDNMKVGNLLKYAASFYKKDCSKRIDELANLMDLDLSKKINDLSFGNRKKVGIVQALLHEPKLIILDEPTSGLDPLVQHRFFDLLREENKKGATIFFSSHVLSEVQRLCDRVGIIKEGEIVKIEEMHALQEKNYKKVKLETKDPISDTVFQMEGVNDYKTQGEITSFLFKGDMNRIIRKFAEINVTNIWIEEPDLEEIFMYYYEKEA